MTASAPLTLHTPRTVCRLASGLVAFISLATVTPTVAARSNPPHDVAPVDRLPSAAAARLFDFPSDRSDSPDPSCEPTGRVIARFDGTQTPRQIEAQLATAGLSDVRAVSPLNLYVFDVEASSGAAGGSRGAFDLLDRLRALPLRLHADFDCRGGGGNWVSTESSTETWSVEQWHLDNPTGVDIDAPEAWAITTGSNAVVIGMVDSGTVSDHPELAGRLYRSPEDPTNETDDEGDGWRDDETGWDFVTGDALADDQHNHGSWVAGMVAAVADNQFGVSGLDHAARIAPLKVLDETNRGFTSDLIAALDYALLHPEIRIVNLSLIDFPDEPLLRSAIQALAEQAILVACAGNAGPGTADQQFPGAYPETISVAWTDRDDQIAPASSSGSTVDVSAPGLDVATIAPSSVDDEYQLVSGCSFATPLVSGALSLTLAVRPQTDISDARFLLQRTVHDLGPAGWDEDSGWGRLDVDDLLVAAQDLIHQGGFETGDGRRWN